METAEKEILEELESRLQTDVVRFNDNSFRHGTDFDFWKWLSEYANSILSLVDRLKMDKGLKPMPCPFCGHAPSINDIFGDRFEICCENDDCPIAPSTYPCASKEDAIEAWNTREKNDGRRR